jgi:hypothetical protein
MTPMLFVTGMPRGGTTLVEKLLSLHSQISLLSQPFPFLFLEAKRAFLQTHGRQDEPYPLGDLFLERDYTVADFSRHLRSRAISPEIVHRTLADMRGYSGQYTKFDPAAIDRALAQLPAGGFLDILAALWRTLAQNPAARYVGAKETGCEEFLPALLQHGARCVLVVRDPRDVLASLNHGRGPEFGGTPKPTLFNLRQWRKSVAFMIHLRRDPNFAWLRYEDLVATPDACLNRLADWLEVEPFPQDAFAMGVRDQDGRPWPGNSSHASARGLDTASVGAHASVLEPDVTTFAEAACFPEMRYLGYPMSLSWQDVPQVLNEFVDPYAGLRENLRATFSDPGRRVEELERVRRLSSSTAESDRYFIFCDVGEQLKHAVTP